MKRLMAVIALVTMAHSALALDIEVHDANDFVVIRQKDGVSYVAEAAIRKTHISTVRVDRAGASYALTIITVPAAGEKGSSTVERYVTRSGSETTMRRAFDSIMKLIR